MPIVGSVYWDPQTQQLRVDAELSRVTKTFIHFDYCMHSHQLQIFVEMETSVEQSKTKTGNHR